MNINTGNSFIQITQGVATPTRPNSQDGASSARPAVRQFTELLRNAGQVQHAGPAGQVQHAGPAGQVQHAGPAGQVQHAGPAGQATQSHETVEIIQPDTPRSNAPPRDLPRGSIVNITV